MNGKELGLVVVGAVLFGGGAGALAAHLVGSGPAAVSDDTRFGDRVERLENALSDTRVELKKSQRARDHLEERLTKSELRLSGVLNDRGTGARNSVGAAGSGPEDAGDAGVAHAARTRQVDTEQRKAELGMRAKVLRSSITHLSTDFAAKMKKYKLAAKLRALPEDERWEKAREEMYLTDGQVTELQSAIAERDHLLKAARKQTEIELPDGNKFTTTTVDPTQMKTAQKAFSDRVDGVLNSDQKTAWSDKGYDQAFGNRRGARTMMITTSGKSSTPGGGGGASISIGVFETDDESK